MTSLISHFIQSNSCATHSLTDHHSFILAPVASSIKTYSSSVHAKIIKPEIPGAEELHCTEQANGIEFISIKQTGEHLLMLL